ncbi:hypothetical protein BJ508DRAFT_12934 [Ascobolus immersus RN42]|uniref:Uncharacterized protein n=1 Tax=Ascobolus immersus RN42 TaxID=1160509 RepID=A0A3N4II36_ASCIM|nr:hypothetical protein BJ508DRAFT_12934 [Ascobolus immersus RN42]
MRTEHGSRSLVFGEAHPYIKGRVCLCRFLLLDFISHPTNSPSNPVNRFLYSLLIPTRSSQPPTANMQLKFFGLIAAFAVASVAALGDFELSQLRENKLHMEQIHERMVAAGVAAPQVQKRSALDDPTGGESTESPLEAAQYKLHVIQDYRLGIANTNDQVLQSTELTEEEKADFVAQAAVTDAELADEEAAVVALIAELSA